MLDGYICTPINDAGWHGAWPPISTDAAWPAESLPLINDIGCSLTMKLHGE